MKILLVGATGGMGKTVTELCENSKDFKIVAGIGIGSGERLSYPLYQNFEDIKEKVDIILDFSHHSLIGSILNYTKEEQKPLVIATTGHTAEEIEKINKASEELPIFFTGNMSIGINILLAVVENLSKGLFDFDIEIIEKHHNLKKDSPSGTAKMLFDAANKGRGNELVEKDGREGTNLSREKSEVGVHAIRGGTIVGEHTVLFAGLDETIEITHRAQSKKVFGAGALKACSFIINQSKGLYDMKDILNF
ncbi:4-hydroxy-tetrahydrodipicolinate reductase [Anaerosphaera multitolerans]|uniref:4-hydroxy-tetrahydrodipicolinate reductase n=1 Tax=Anaerosphaera multitolerans TaxID=2487351 RepID=A0A437S631_9FIRM|nr:4-hydroxy-tetrahydrodipicolinate reductase [Anaerosphaera multitolerans]RVU54454.1 4-hydroxy-tetrahydrodipicolinate reductase [Anaerosphaera multitolerans]